MPIPTDYNGAHRTGTKLQHPTKCAAIILADQGYPDDGPLLTPARAGQMHLLNRRERRRARKFNRALSKRRVKIEYVIKEVKTFKAVSQVWRHPRWLMTICVELATLLVERRLRFSQSLMKRKGKRKCIFVSKSALILGFNFLFPLICAKRNKHIKEL